jgi:hypothetical protein
MVRLPLAGTTPRDGEKANACCSASGRIHSNSASSSSLNDECKLVLSPKDIQNIITPVKMLDFGQVSDYSTNTKSFFVYNGLKNNIWDNLQQGIREELALSTPSVSMSSSAANLPRNCSKRHTSR